jgi:hypothetical protein
MPNIVHPPANDIPPAGKAGAKERESFAPPFFDRLSPFLTVFPGRPKRDFLEESGTRPFFAGRAAVRKR